MGTTFETSELECLRALRRAAAELHASTVMQEGRPVSASIKARRGEHVHVSGKGNDPERFRSFMISLRKTYAEGDGANFLRSVNILSKHLVERRESLSSLRKSYLAALRNSQMDLLGNNAEDVFEAWLYGSVFHDDDPDQRRRWQELTANPLLAQITRVVMENTGINLARHVIALDAVVADVLGEDRLPPLPEPRREDDSEHVEIESAAIEVRVRRRRGSRLIDFVNRGPGVAEELTVVGFEPLDEGTESVLFEGELEQVLPVPRLRPGEKATVSATVTHGSPTRFEITVEWRDASGDRREVFRIDLLRG